MELKRRVDLRKIVSIVYAIAFATYIFVGLTPAEASNLEISGELRIPNIALTSDVTTLNLVDHKLNTPDTIVGAYKSAPGKTFLVGHASTVFKDLDLINVNDYIYYNNKVYEVVDIEMTAKKDVDMDEILAPTLKNTLIIMTCAGTPVGNNDATHRLIVTALEK